MCGLGLALAQWRSMKKLALLLATTSTLAIGCAPSEESSEGCETGQCDEPSPVERQDSAHFVEVGGCDEIVTDVIFGGGDVDFPTAIEQSKACLLAADDAAAPAIDAVAAAAGLELEGATSDRLSRYRDVSLCGRLGDAANPDDKPLPSLCELAWERMLAATIDEFVAFEGADKATMGSDGRDVSASCYESFDGAMAAASASDEIYDIHMDLADCVHGRAIGQMGVISKGIIDNFPDRDPNDVIGSMSIDMQNALRAMTDVCANLGAASGASTADAAELSGFLCEAQLKSRLLVLIDSYTAWLGIEQ